MKLFAEAVKAIMPKKGLLTPFACLFTAALYAIDCLLMFGICCCFAAFAVASCFVHPSPVISFLTALALIKHLTVM